MKQDGKKYFKLVKNTNDIPGCVCQKLGYFFVSYEILKLKTRHRRYR